VLRIVSASPNRRLFALRLRPAHSACVLDFLGVKLIMSFWGEACHLETGPVIVVKSPYVGNSGNFKPRSMRPLRSQRALV